MKKILMLGSLPQQNITRSIGGATNYTQNIYDELLKQKDIDVTFVQIRKHWKKGGQVIDFIKCFFVVLFNIRKYDCLSIHASWDFHITIGPFITLIGKIHNKKIVYHLFGGYFHKMYESYPLILKAFLKNTIFSSNYILVETKQMESFFCEIGVTNVKWFPNSRKESIKTKDNSYNKRFIFLSRIETLKGINLFLEAMNDLPKDYTLHVYGPIDENYTHKKSLQNNTNYKGIVPPELVLETLLEYDVLVLPTLHKTEGYPGVFIEAMSVGLPIITTKISVFKELIKDYENGILISKNSLEELNSAILYFNEENYSDFLNSSLKKFSTFKLDNIVQQLITYYKND
jgi:glycosyltransferase involved in cell wall biosynthesis